VWWTCFTLVNRFLQRSELQDMSIDLLLLSGGDLRQDVYV